MAAGTRGLAVRPQSTLDIVQEALGALAARYRADEVITSVKHIPAREAIFRPMPAWVRPALAAAYRAKGIEKLYSHQAAAAERARAGKELRGGHAHGLRQNALLQPARAERGPGESRYARALPLSHQGARAGPARRIARSGDAPRRRFGVFTYDGDTPSDARKAIRERGHVILTNPDMLHTGILPHHTKWTRLFENLRYIVLDELHTYRGVFGSHLANVLRRLAAHRALYGSRPQFICCSATIANPGELAEQLIEKKWR
jgi:DEAD/DEAH box helicase domain-containing protein